jgi:hypothetical protein
VVDTRCIDKHMADTHTSILTADISGGHCFLLVHQKAW